MEKSGNDSSLEIKYKYYASYYAERGKEKVKKHGIHQMDILQRDDRYAEYPVEMAGYFGDTARDAADGNIQQHFGSLFFFRIRESLGNKLKEMDCPEKRLEFIREQVKTCLDGKETPYPEIARLCETIRLVRTDSEEAVKQ